MGAFKFARAIEYDWFLLINPTNHIKLLGEQASCFANLNAPNGCDPLDELSATNALKHSIDQSEDRILQINQSKNALKHS